jgi:hypothetical protein
VVPYMFHKSSSESHFPRRHSAGGVGGLMVCDGLQSLIDCVEWAFMGP